MNEDQKADLLDRLIGNPPGREQLLSDAGASPDEREELLALAQTADSVWLANREPPSLDEDPIAVMLGVAPAGAAAVDPAAFKAARTRSGLSISRLRDRLVARGWNVTTQQVASWQSRTGIELLPALLEDIGSALGAAVDSFIAVRADEKRSLHATLRSTAWFNALAEQWQATRGVVRSVAEAQLLTRATATVHRGEEPDIDQIHDLLQHLVKADNRPGDLER